MSEPKFHWYQACSVQDIPIRAAIRIQYRGRKIAVFKTAKNEIRALDDRCPHKGGPLSDGIVHGDCVTCPLHNWDISLETGRALGADEGYTKRYNVKVESGHVYIQLPFLIALSVA